MPRRGHGYSTIIPVVGSSELFWQRGACSRDDVDANLFNEETQRYRVADNPRLNEAADICMQRCPVVAECRDFGRRNRLSGIYGGLYLHRGDPQPLTRGAVLTKEEVI